MTYTLVTGFFDIGRDKWNHKLARKIEEYLNNSKRVFTLKNDIVVFIEPKFVDFVTELSKQREHKTIIIPLKKEDLPYYKYKDQMQKIVENPNFKHGFELHNHPDNTYPEYNIIMWSKIWLVNQAKQYNNTTHYVWIDFGLHPGLLKDEHLNKPLLHSIPDKIKLLCREIPANKFLEYQFYRKNLWAYLAGGLITGSSENFEILEHYFDNEVKLILKHQIMLTDQNILTILLIKHPELFELYYGDWFEIISNYYETDPHSHWYLQNRMIDRIQHEDDPLSEKIRKEIEDILKSKNGFKNN